MRLLSPLYYICFLKINPMDAFVNRHNGPNAEETAAMLQQIGVKSIDELIAQTVPQAIRLQQPLAIGQGMTEFEYLNHIRGLGRKNKLFRSYIGAGYYGTILPPVIQRNILENPGWYTAYTPYQAEISQGRLEALLNYQTMICSMTGMPVANASLLDEATAAAEAMSMFFSSRSREKEKAGAVAFFVSSNCFPQTLDVITTRAIPLGIEVVTGTPESFKGGEKFFGALIQYPDSNGSVTDPSVFIKNCQTAGIPVAVGADLLSLALLRPPGEMGADVVFGNSQRFGVPMGFGGPHAAFFAAKEDYKRLFPGRIIGVSVDADGRPALRMALQTREQHIRREKATSNICTAQALLAIMASMYAVYHGPKGIRSIAAHIHSCTAILYRELKKAGINVKGTLFFDTLHITGADQNRIRTAALATAINLQYKGNDEVIIALDETVSSGDLNDLLGIFGIKSSVTADTIHNEKGVLQDSGLKRTSPILDHPIFSSYHSESEMMRYIKRLENKDLSLTHSMISLGSCTMKLNAASELLPLTWPEFANLHPFVPSDQAEGYLELINTLNRDLAVITGFAGMSFQPNSGAQGEYAGLLVIRAFHLANGNTQRNIALIPTSAHGTNPASAAMAGMKIVLVKCDEKGNIDIADLKQKAEQHKNELSCLMVTYPSTHGVFEEGIREITGIIHDNGGQVYMDGANMNAQVGLTSPGNIGADVCHLNLHKTFAIPHGGGGPGMGPIGVAKHLLPFLPGHPFVKSGSDKAIPAVSAAPFGSALILLISYGYIKMLGGPGLKAATCTAILNANYMKEILKDHYPILYVGTNGRVAHEMILDCKDFKKTSGVEVGDMAKRLMDYGFHAPTVAFPVHDTLMVEPTESESKAELDRFCEALIQIRQEIEAIEKGQADPANNLLKNAPHTVRRATADQWKFPYTRQAAVYPLKWVKDNKFWPSVGRVDNAAGDRNLVCTCPPLEQYAEVVA
ncbi:MAG: aminomethyl-transferring glycine dehydrogenase [Bacteroidia bacterium]|nr:aminomethyl-transferring glycine dehydrogenase [Bacteroidia bacterium]